MCQEMSGAGYRDAGDRQDRDQQTRQEPRLDGRALRPVPRLPPPLPEVRHQLQQQNAIPRPIPAQQVLQETIIQGTSSAAGWKNTSNSNFRGKRPAVYRANKPASVESTLLKGEKQKRLREKAAQNNQISEKTSLLVKKTLNNLYVSKKMSTFAPNLGAYGKEERNSESRIGINPAVGEH
jgi:hypothetical protein